MKSFSQFVENQESLAGENGEVIHHPSGHGFIDVHHKNLKFAPRKQSIVNFKVKEGHRGKGIGKDLLKSALSKHNDLGGQASSEASVHVMHKAGFRNPSMPKGSIEDHVKALHKDSSVYMAHKDEHGNPYV